MRQAVSCLKLRPLTPDPSQKCLCALGSGCFQGRSRTAPERDVRQRGGAELTLGTSQWPALVISRVHVGRARRQWPKSQTFQKLVCLGVALLAGHLYLAFAAPCPEETWSLNICLLSQLDRSVLEALPPDLREQVEQACAVQQAEPPGERRREPINGCSTGILPQPVGTVLLQIPAPQDPNSDTGINLIALPAFSQVSLCGCPALSTSLLLWSSQAGPGPRGRRAACLHITHGTDADRAARTPGRRGGRLWCGGAQSSPQRKNSLLFLGPLSTRDNSSQGLRFQAHYIHTCFLVFCSPFSTNASCPFCFCSSIHIQSCIPYSQPKIKLFENLMSFDSEDLLRIHTDQKSMI